MGNSVEKQQSGKKNFDKQPKKHQFEEGQPEKKLKQQSENRQLFAKDGKKKVLFILGPTAVGKSEIAVRLAKEFDGEVISADSVQIFKGLDIGSAKITKDEMSGVAHYGIDICEPEENFSAFEFAEFTQKKIDQIAGKGKLPIVVGGTGLYVRSLVEGFDFADAPHDENLRQQLEQLKNEKGVDALFEILQKENPAAAEKIDRKNPTRIVRAIEIARAKSEKGKKETAICPLVLALVRPREKLYADINTRVDKMMQKGLVREVEGLKKRGLSAQNQSMRAIGYKEVLAFLDGEISEQQMSELVKQHSRNYAKRQLTFLRGMKCEMVDVENREEGFEQIRAKVKKFLSTKTI